MNDAADADLDTPLLMRVSGPYYTHEEHHSIRKSRDPGFQIESQLEGTDVRRSVEDDVIPETAVLGRNLGWSSAYIIIISRVVGSGIFATPGTIVSSVGSIGLSLCLWVVGALISWLGLAVTLEYGCMLPRSGGGGKKNPNVLSLSFQGMNATLVFVFWEKIYLEFTYRRPRFLASTLVAVNAVLLGFTASNCIVFAEYVLFAMGKEADRIHVKILAVGLMTVVTVIHGCFLKIGIFIQNVLGWVKIALVVFMVIASAVIVVSHTNNTGYPTPSHTLYASWDGIWKGSVWDWGIISTTLLKIFYSYAGLQNVNNVMSEVRNPVSTLKSAATTGLITACLLYFLINIAYFIVIPLDDIKESGELIAALFFERTFGAALGKVFLPLAVSVSAAGNVMVVTFALARLNQEIARQGFLPFGALLASSRPYGAPLGGLLVHYIPSVAVISIPAKNIYSFILEVEGYPGQFFALAMSFGLIWLRWKRPDLNRPYRAFLPAVWGRIALSIALIVSPFVPRDGEKCGDHLLRVSYALVGISVILLGLLYWFLWTVLLPRWGDYQLEEATDSLDDGTIITRLIHSPRDCE